MRTIAFYLPQFHSIPENDNMWGEGFTEWDNMKKSKKLFDGHYQPRIPLNNNYYNLLDDSVLKWQVDLANEYGVDAFCFYHYWFDGKKLLEKPVERFLELSNLNKNYCLCWANEAWTKAWVSKNDDVLYPQVYGNEKNWEEHFRYLLPFFKDSRYIKDEGKPLFVIYRPELIECLNEMLDYFNERAIEEGFKGMCFAYQQIAYDLLPDKDESRFTYNIEYEPAYSMNDLNSKRKWYTFLFNIGKKIDKITMKLINRTLSSVYLNKVRTLNYDDLWEKCINRIPSDEKHVACVFTDWDNTPRRGNKGIVAVGANPKKFKKYLELKKEMIDKYYANDYVFIFAWNEWAEGGYLEPDEKYGYGYLEAIRSVFGK